MLIPYHKGGPSRVCGSWVIPKKSPRRAWPTEPYLQTCLCADAHLGASGMAEKGLGRGATGLRPPPHDPWAPAQRAVQDPRANLIESGRGRPPTPPAYTHVCGLLTDQEIKT